MYVRTDGNRGGLVTPSQGTEAVDEYSEIENSLVWRYLDLAKFLDLIQTSELHFTRLDQLEDPYEHAIQSAACQRKPIDSQTVYVNCWILSQYESAAMWTIYGGNSGIAIQSSRQRVGSVLKLPSMLGIEGVTMTGFGRVRYVDDKRIAELLATTGASPTNTVSSFNKRMSFSHENEIRMALGLNGEHQERQHLRLQVDLNDLIERIYVSPSSPTWLAKVVRELALAYGIKKDVLRSELLSLKLT